MNKSLNEMMEDFVLTQNQLKMLRSRQSSTLEEMNQQGKILRSHSDRFSKLHEKLELADIKEVTLDQIIEIFILKISFLAL